MAAGFPGTLGPWADPATDPDHAASHPWIPGKLLEIKVCFEDFSDVGKAIVFITSKGEMPRLFGGQHLAVEGDYYRWWVFASGAAAARPDAKFRMEGNRGDDREVRFRKQSVTPALQWRLLNYEWGAPRLEAASWLDLGEEPGLATEIEAASISSSCPN